jgi:hypothetical protein
MKGATTPFTVRKIVDAGFGHHFTGAASIAEIARKSVES